jgi:hypothetical protein
MDPSDYYGAPINKVLHFIRSVGLIKEYTIGEAQQTIEGRGARAGFLAHPFYIHTYIHIYNNLTLENKFIRKCNDGSRMTIQGQN